MRRRRHREKTISAIKSAAIKDAEIAAITPVRCARGVTWASVTTVGVGFRLDELWEIETEGGWLIDKGADVDCSCVDEDMGILEDELGAREDVGNKEEVTPEDEDAAAAEGRCELEDDMAFEEGGEAEDTRVLDGFGAELEAVRG
jgi:hypothetical protein